MLSKISPKRIKEEDIHEYFVNANKKSVHRNDKYTIKLLLETLNMQLTKKVDAFILEFDENSGLFSSETIKILAKAIRPLKMVRKIDFLCSP